MRTSVPSLPEQWSSGFVSYYDPRGPSDFCAAGSVWVDYRRGRMRIEGLRSPWDVVGTGCQLWMCEVFDVEQRLVTRVSVKYSGDRRERTVERETWDRGLFLPRDLLTVWQCTLEGRTERYGRAVDVWESAVGEGRVFLDAETGNLLARETVEAGRRRFKEFPNPQNYPIPEVVFSEIRE